MGKERCNKMDQYGSKYTLTQKITAENKSYYLDIQVWDSKRLKLEIAKSIVEIRFLFKKLIKINHLKYKLRNI
jgi:hypothetical protein